MCRIHVNTLQVVIAGVRNKTGGLSTRISGQVLLSKAELETVVSHLLRNALDSMGLGMAEAHALVNNAGGRFEVHSAPGQGTRITVCLPWM